MKNVYYILIFIVDHNEIYERWGSIFLARHQKANIKAEFLQSERTFLEVIPHNVRQFGMSIERVINLEVERKEIEVSIFFVSSIICN